MNKHTYLISFTEGEVPVIRIYTAIFSEVDSRFHIYDWSKENERYAPFDTIKEIEDHWEMRKSQGLIDWWYRFEF